VKLSNKLATTVFLTKGYLNPALVQAVLFKPNCKNNQIDRHINKF